MSEIRLVLVTAPASSADVDTMLTSLLEARVVACVTRVPGIRSQYWWQDKLEDSEEELLILKTTAARVSELEQMIKKLHPYENPEFLVFPVEHAAAAYQAWVLSETRSPNPDTSAKGDVRSPK